MSTVADMFRVVCALFESPLVLSLTAVGVVLGVAYVAFEEGREFERQQRRPTPIRIPRQREGE